LSPTDGLRSTMTLCTPKAFKRAASATAALPAPTMKTSVLISVKSFEHLPVDSSKDLSSTCSSRLSSLVLRIQIFHVKFEVPSSDACPPTGKSHIIPLQVAAGEPVLKPNGHTMNFCGVHYLLVISNRPEDAIVERSLTRFGPAFLCLQQVFRNLGWRDEGATSPAARLLSSYSWNPDLS
ncbi:hypothetical protein KCV06_g514, partial [Aureobasidium melanogenum]